MQLTVTSPDGLLFRGEVEKASLPTPQGIIGILPGHMTLATALASGYVSYIPRKYEAESSLESYADPTETITIIGGLALIEKDIITVTAD